ncbi:MAG: nucleotide exchange factor GrpE [Pseudomonadales bacterium]|nr:nucleotide exchange factor GrpE [Pseudomonadales bacterium]
MSKNKPEENLDNQQTVQESMGEEPVVDGGNDNADKPGADGTEEVQLNREQILAAQLEEAQNQLTQQKEEVLRVQAEMQNLRRRTEQDIEKAHKYGQEKFSAELLVVIDNLERALLAAGDKEDGVVKALYEGVELTLKSFLDCFRKFHIEQIDPVGEPFDPQLHQAVVMQESAEAEPDSVLAVMQKGYTLHGRVIRPAMVIVARAPVAGIDEQV